MPEPDATLNIAAPTDLLLAISQAIILVDTQPAGRDIALCKTKLDEAMFWGARSVGLVQQALIAAKATAPPPPPPPPPIDGGKP